MPDYYVTQRGVKPMVDFLNGEFSNVPRPSTINRSGLVYTDKVVLITGGANGIGEGTARVFVDAGARVMICDIDVEAGDRLAAELTEKGPGVCEFTKCDVSVPEEMCAAIDHTLARFGRLDCLFNNAGFHPTHMPLENFSVEDLNQLWQTNFVSQFVACKHALPHLRETQGSIINMSSCTGKLGQEGGALYAATKAAISAFTKSLALEEATRGVRVNTVLPGNVYTESRGKAVNEMGQFGQEVDRWADAMQPTGRSASPEEAGQIVLFLASDAASFLTGVELMVTSGIELGTGVKYPPMWVEHQAPKPQIVPKPKGHIARHDAGTAAGQTTD